jgi:lysophospholipid acyltransferase (LPLAT)-like uncharacterized protein
MKDWWRRVRPGLISGLAYFLVRLVGMTLRIRTVNFERVQNLPGGKVICGWHGRSFVATARFRNLGYWVIISKSRDGDIQNRIFSGLGFRCIRGSTGRGGERALIESIRALRQGAIMAITPDGPRGPSGVLQGGVMAMARKSGAALIPVGISARPRVQAKSWDRYMVPLPFARAIMIFGEPIYVPPDAADAEVEEIRLRLQDAMNRIEAEAEQALFPHNAARATT